MKQESKRPLYKVLNEQRTQGEWKMSNDKYSIETADSAKLGIAELYATERSEANAQYTALAVNNLHLLAEALKNAMGQIKQLAVDYAGYSLDENAHNYYGKIATYANAKEALNRIS